MTNPQPHQPTTPQIPPLTTAQKVKYIFFGLLFIAIIGWWIAGNIANSSHDSNLKKNGVHTTGTADGSYHEYVDRHKGGTTTKYNAKYEYTTQDGIDTKAIGEKKYDAPEDIRVGAKADVYYDPSDASKGTYVENEE